MKTTTFVYKNSDIYNVYHGFVNTRKHQNTKTHIVNERKEILYSSAKKNENILIVIVILFLFKKQLKIF